MSADVKDPEHAGAPQREAGSESSGNTGRREEGCRGERERRRNAEKDEDRRAGTPYLLSGWAGKVSVAHAVVGIASSGAAARYGGVGEIFMEGPGNSV
ncbi:unnamed protein product [Tilletia controversa]|nr:unnamed protein product [Tilletia controversa]